MNKNKFTDPQRQAVADGGGHLAVFRFDHEAWNKQLCRDEVVTSQLVVQGGCGEELYTFGRGSVWIRCGMVVHLPNGTHSKEFCGKCRATQ